MSKNQIQQLVVIALLLVFIGMWTLMRKSSAPAGPVLPPKTESVPAPASSPAKESVEAPPATLARDPFGLPQSLLDQIRNQETEKKQEEEEQRRQEELRANPGRPTQPLMELPNLKLQAVFWGTANPQAIINRQTVSVGDTLEGARIISISKNGVTVSINGQETELKPENNIGKPPNER